MNPKIFALIPLFFVTNCLADQARPAFVPYTLECRVFSNKYPGVPDHHDNEWKKVTLTDLNEAPGGHQRVGKIGDYEFWVITGETLGLRTVFTYVAAIKNLKTGIVAEARSDDREKPEGDEATKIAQVALKTYNDKSLMESSTLQMDCMHPTVETK